jgi:hypothetical protein
VLFAEEHALLGLIVHAILGGALVAASTHLAIWMRGFPRGQFSRARGVRKLAAISLALFVVAFVSGNLLYPTYKIRVRGEYLEEGTAVVRDYRNRMIARDLFRRKSQPAADTSESTENPTAAEEPSLPATARDAPTEARLPHETAKLARWFDVKEHWVALGLALSIACAVLLFGWKPDRRSRLVGSTAFALAICAAATTWLGAIIGIVTAATRSVAPLG